MQVTVEMPDQVARQWGETPDTVGRHVMEDAAIEGYRAGRLTQRQVGAMPGWITGRRKLSFRNALCR